MTQMLTLLSILAFLPGFVFGQSAGAPSEPQSFPTVMASKVEVGLGTKLMQVASIALNPWQRNTHWPLFAYPVKTVFSSRKCNSFSGITLGGEVAFVRPNDPRKKTPRKFLGIQIRDASQIQDICKSDNHSETLQNLLSLKTETGIDWYLLSERPLQHIESSFRTSMVPFDVGADNGNTPSVTESEAPQSGQ